MKISVFSQKVLKGQIKFDLKKLTHLLARYNLSSESCQFLPFDKEKIIAALKEDGDKLVFLENEQMDDVIVDNINLLGNDKVVYEELGVRFKRENGSITFLPLDLDWEKLAVKVFEQTKKDDMKYCKFHLFGKSTTEVENTLLAETKDLNYSVLGDNLLVDVYAAYKGEDNLIDNQQVKIAGLFRDNLYSENDLSLKDIAIQLLRLKGLKIAIKENITGGKILSLLSENESFKEVLKVGSVEFNKLPLTAERVYNDALGVLSSSLSDVVLTIDGAFDEKGLGCMIAIGDKHSVHVYNNRFNAERERAIEMASACALFHLVKKLRQNDFAF